MTTTWKIGQLKRRPTTGLVFEVNYSMNFKLQNETDRKVGMIELEGDVNDSNFISYENLTEAVVLEWVKTTLGETKIIQIENEFKTKLEGRIARKANPEFLTGKPWEQE
jgi:hypothetical protein